MREKIYFIVLLILCITNVYSQQQNNDNPLIQLSGFVVNYDSTKIVPYASIHIEGTSRGTFADMSGFFSFVARKKDKLVFSSIGYTSQVFHFPSDFNDTKLITVIRMADDTFYLPEFVVHPFSTPEEFDYYFVKSRSKNDNLALAYSNLRRVPFDMLAKGISLDGIETYRWYQQQRADLNYYNGQSIPMKVFDAFAWSEFIKSLNKKKKK